MHALQVPCDARLNRRDVNSLSLGQHIPTSPPHPVLLGEPEREIFKSRENTMTKDKKNIIVILACLWPEAILLLYLDTGLRRYDDCVFWMGDLSCQVPLNRF